MQNSKRKVFVGSSSTNPRVAFIPLESTGGSSSADQQIRREVKNNHSLLRETFNAAILDFGTSVTVCGSAWLDCYVNSLTSGQREKVASNSSSATVKFMNGKVVNSLRNVRLPTKLGTEEVLIETEVVQLSIPLLLSEHSLRAANAKLDLVNNCVTMLSQRVDIGYTTSGHVYISLANNPDPNDTDIKALYIKSVGEKPKLASKLHTHFDHAPSSFVIFWMKDVGINDPELFCYIMEAERSCQCCTSENILPVRPLVRLALSKEFNSVVSICIEPYKEVNALYIVDHATRFTMVSVVREWGSLMDMFNDHWIRMFQCPVKIMVDDGGVPDHETKLFREVTGQFDTERSGRIDSDKTLIRNILNKMESEYIDHPLEIIFLWAANTKNSFPTVHGTSANQLVFGKDLDFSLFSRLKEGYSLSEVIYEYFTILQSAREDFSRNRSFGMRKD